MSTPVDPDVPEDDHEFAAWLAEEAGQVLLAVREHDYEGAELKAAGDAAAQALIAKKLGAYRPEDAVLSVSYRSAWV